MATAVLRREEVMRRLGVGRTKLKEMVRDGELPAPIRVSGAVQGWPDDEITRFINHRIAVSRGEPNMENSNVA